MCRFREIVFEAIEQYEVRGQNVPVLLNPTKREAEGFQRRYGSLRASALWDGNLMVWSANLAIHGDIYEGDDQWPVVVIGGAVIYRIDSSLNDSELAAHIAQSARTELKDHKGLRRAFGDFRVEIDSPDSE